MAAGPLVGGFLTTIFSWRFVFAGEVVIVLLARFAKDEGVPQPIRIDALSVTLFAIGSVALIYAMLQITTWGLIPPLRPPVVAAVTIEPLGLSPVPFLFAFGALLVWLFAGRQGALAASGRTPLLDLAQLSIAPLRAVDRTTDPPALDLPHPLLRFGTRLSAIWSPRRIMRLGQVLLVLSSLVLVGSISSLATTFLATGQSSDLPAEAKSRVEPAGQNGIAVIAATDVAAVATRAGLSLEDSKTLGELCAESQVDALRPAIFAVAASSAVSLLLSKIIPNTLVGGQKTSPPQETSWGRVGLGPMRASATRRMPERPASANPVGSRAKRRHSCRCRADTSFGAEDRDNAHPDFDTACSAVVNSGLFMREYPTIFCAFACSRNSIRLGAVDRGERGRGEGGGCFVAGRVAVEAFAVSLASRRAAFFCFTANLSVSLDNSAAFSRSFLLESRTAL